SALSTLVQVLESDVISPRAVNRRISPELEQVCLRCLEKRPELRYASAAALAEDLERHVRDEPVSVQAASLGLRLRNSARRNPALAYRLPVLALCGAFSHVNYLFQHPTPLGLHARILGALFLGAAVSALCQWPLHRRWHPGLIRFVWSGADVGL